MDRIPSNHRQAERQLIQLVRDGRWRIDAAGRVWRVTKRGERRAEKRLPAGYLMVRAMLDGVRVCGLAHRLVWQHFKGDIPDGLVINHHNGLKDDNRPENLETGSYSSNMKHAHRSGLLDEHGQRNPGAKLTDNEVAQIRNAYASGAFTQQQLAERFGVRFQHISRVVRGQRRPKQGGPVADRDHRHAGSGRDPKTGRFVEVR